MWRVKTHVEWEGARGRVKMWIRGGGRACLCECVCGRAAHMHECACVCTREFWGDRMKREIGGVCVFNVCAHVRVFV